MGTPGVCWDTLPISTSGTLAKSHSLWLAEKGSPAYISHCSAAVSGHHGRKDGSTQGRLRRSGWPSPLFLVWSHDLLHAGHQCDHPRFLQSFIRFYDQAMRDHLQRPRCSRPLLLCTLVFLVWSTAAPHALCSGLHGGPQGVAFQCSSPVSANAALSGGNDPCR